MVPVLWCQYVTTGAVGGLNGACSLVSVCDNRSSEQS